MVDLAGGGETGMHRTVLDRADTDVSDGIWCRPEANTGC